ncbi:MAG: hypothetical protein KF752_13275 [Pirellulaceae bacterium]|nr:hypothetical protein [Pirellulaceae bacterium]
MTNPTPTIQFSLGAFEEESLNTRPVSNVAVLSLMVGLCSLLVPLSGYLLPLSLLAIVLGGVLSYRLSRPDADAGVWMANVCLGLGLMSAVWVIVANRMHSDYLSATASRHAAEFLSLVAQGKNYEAMELRLPNAQRQPADMNLQDYYEAYEGVVVPEMAMLGLFGGGEETRDPLRERKLSSLMFRQDPVITHIQHNPTANWRYQATKEIQYNKEVTRIQVVMRSDQDASKPVVIELMRNLTQEHADIAEWRVNRIFFLDSH